MATYAEFLKSQGASDDEVKILDVPVARKAWEASEATRIAAEKDRANLNEWYETKAVPAYKAMEQDMMSAKADAARNAALIKAATDQGLIEVAKRAGVTDEHIAAPTTTAPDLSKYVTSETLLQVAEREGDAIAIAQDIAFEHRQLFPDRPLNFRELRREAVSRKIAVETLWMEKFGVAAARDKRAADEKATYEKKLRDEGAQAAREELASRYGNPDTRPYVPSVSPLAARPATGRDKQPWELGGNDSLVGDRVKRATDNLLKSTMKN